MSLRKGAVAPLLITFLSLVAPAAMARTYWVAPGGVAGAAGSDSSSAPTTLAWFNANAAAGDVCRFKSGTYSDPIFPARDGTSAARIRYYGFPNDPSAVTVADIRFGYAHGNYCTARWVSCTAGATGLYEAGATEATDDTIASCRISGQGSAFNVMSQRSVVDSMTITGTLAASGQSHFVNLGGERNHNNGTIGQWSIGSLNNRVTNSTFNVTVAAPGDIHVLMVTAAAYNRIAGNVFNMTLNSCTGYFFGSEMYEGYYNQIENNDWNFQMNGAIGGSHGMWCHRDSSSYNRYVKNRVHITGTGSDLSFMLSNGGSFPATTGNNYYGNNYIDAASPQAGTGIFWYYNGVRNDTLEYNTIVTASTKPCLLVTSGNEITGLVSRHNTYVTSGATAIDASGASASNSPRFSSDIFYCRAANGSGAENVRVSSGVALDSAGVYFSPGGTPARAISYAGADGAPGAGGTFGLPLLSVWGSPRFADSSATSFNGTLGSLSAAISTGLLDGFAGAYPAGGGADVTPPATVTDLHTSQPTVNSLQVAWTAPGDDGMTGTATLYDLRWSTSPITSANFGSAASALPEPVPAVAGTVQTYTLSGLAQATTYYFAIRTRDDAGNWSAVSASASGATLADTIPPAAVNDLTPGP
jgi:hypothetical protein